MTTAARAIDAIEQLHTFFVQHQVGDWAQRSRQAIDELGKQDADVDKILWKYTGRAMNSIVDIYISADNGHTILTSEKEANQQLEELTTQLFNIQLGIDSKQRPTNLIQLLIRITIVACTLLTIGGQMLYYFNAYKYNQGKVTLSALMIIVGSFILFMLLFWNWLDDNLDADYNVHRRRWLPYNYKKPLAYTIFFAFLIANYFGLPKLAEQRENRILQNEETHETTATVTALKVVKQRRRSNIHLAIIQYQTSSGTITQSIDDECNCHYTGQPIRVVYAEDYPEMFYCP